jgi:trehalose 6-phosphate phosphatase
MALPLFDHLPEIARSLQDAPYVLLFLDFDGTLAPIDPNPGTASMPAGTRKALKALCCGPRSQVAIISGRALPDVRERVRLEELIYAGNHGLEINGPGLHFVEPGAAQRAEALEELARHLKVRLSGVPGVDVESKVFTASVHFRKTPIGRLEEVRRTVMDAIAPIENLFQITQGLKVFDIRPRVNWHKGLAVQWIKDALGKRDALPIYIGDDLTDEDAFAALPEGITVCVGRPRSNTSAHYRLEEQGLVQKFLIWLAGSLAKPDSGR